MHCLACIKKAIAGLLLTALALPIAHLVVFGVAKLLAAMDDQVGAAWLLRMDLALGVLWLVVLIALLLLLAAYQLTREEARAPAPPQDRPLNP